MPPDRFLDREESWLRFNGRVLRLAQSPELPLLERVRFLSIFSNNLDEFFMVRVAGLMRRLATGLPVRTSSGRSPHALLGRIAGLAHQLSIEHAEYFRDEIAPLLAKEDIAIVRWADLEDTERARMQELFRTRVYPVLTPWWWTRRTRSRTSPGSPSTWPCRSATRATGPPGSRA
nr:hypothetical protein GCM10025732_06620 [Glycomyces mayteni]